jgi:ribA/ribD-fused uncharacterized protein
MTDKFKFWKGTKIDELKSNEIFVYGANPEFRNGAGAAKIAQNFGAPRHGAGRRIVGQTYGLVTKNLVEGYYEKATGITYNNEGLCSLTPEMISKNIDELYECAKSNPEKQFLITYQDERWPNKQPKKSFCGYSGKYLCKLFVVEKDIPNNIVFHESFKPLIENDYKKEVKQEFTFFFQSKSPFSQWHPSVFKVNNFTFVSAEQFMMFCKAKLFKDEPIANKIIAFSDIQLCKELIDKTISSSNIINDSKNLFEWNQIQKEIKYLGREVSNYNEQLWCSKRVSYVTRASFEKYNQNPVLKTFLLDTGTTRLVESSKWDKIWGIGLAANDTRSKDSSKWLGQNLLGDLLTNLRDNFALELAKDLNVKKKSSSLNRP